MKEEKLITRKNPAFGELNGTFLIGYLNLNYNEIKSVFGKPTSNGDEYKTDWEWELKLNDTVLTIYNYKDGPNYTRINKIKAKDIKDWHIGGKNRYDVKILEDYIVQEKPEFVDRRLTRRDFFDR